MAWRRLRISAASRDSGEHVPIVAITAYDVYGMEEAAVRKRLQSLPPKPLNLDDLDRALKSLGFLV
jgi:hypothetical protein